MITAKHRPNKECQKNSEWKNKDANEQKEDLRRLQIARHDAMNNKGMTTLKFWFGSLMATNECEWKKKTDEM